MYKTNKIEWEILQSVLDEDGGLVETDLGGQEAIIKAMNLYARKRIDDFKKVIIDG